MKKIYNILGLILIVAVFSGCTYRLKGSPSLWAAKIADGSQSKLPIKKTLYMGYGTDSLKLSINKIYSKDNILYYEATTNYFNTIKEESKIKEFKQNALKPYCTDYLTRKTLDGGLVIVIKIVQENEAPIQTTITSWRCESGGY